MPHQRRDDERSTGRWEPQRAWALSILALGLLLFTWPFVRAPRLAARPAFAAPRRRVAPRRRRARRHGAGAGARRPPAAARTGAVGDLGCPPPSCSPTSRSSSASRRGRERPAARRRPVVPPLVYALSLGVYATDWTFYGSVGFAARSGLLFLTVYLGPTLCAIGWWWVVRKLIRIKAAYRVTGLPDLLALRYERSQAVSLLATGLLVVGLVPYLALQLKTLIATLGLVAGGGARSRIRGLGGPRRPRRSSRSSCSSPCSSGSGASARRSATPGLMVALAVESVVKLVAFVAAGAFVTYGRFDGLADVFRARRRAARPRAGPPRRPRRRDLARAPARLRRRGRPPAAPVPRRGRGGLRRGPRAHRDVALPRVPARA